MGDTRTQADPDDRDPTDAVDDPDRLTDSDVPDPGVAEAANRDHRGGADDLPQDRSRSVAKRVP